MSIDIPHYVWTIDKSADQSELTLAVGQAFPVTYQVFLTADMALPPVAPPLTVLPAAAGLDDYCVNVFDTLFGPLGGVCADAAPVLISYSMPIGPFGAPSDWFSITNTASFVTADSGTTGQDSWTVRVRVEAPTPAPEPGTLALLGLGLAGLAATRRRKT